MDVSVVIPVHNPRRALEETVQRVVACMDTTSLEYEILLRDDGSEPGLREDFKRTVFRQPSIRCFHNRGNRGLGETLRALIRDARGDNVVYCDSDLPFGENIIPALLKRLERCDIAVASRYAGIRSQTTFPRWALSRLYFCFCKALLNIPVVDIGSGSVAIRRKSLERFTLSSKGFDIHAELYARARRSGLCLEEFPAEAQKNEPGSFSIARHGGGVIFGTLRLWHALWQESRESEKGSHAWKKGIFKRPDSRSQQAI